MGAGSTPLLQTDFSCITWNRAHHSVAQTSSSKWSCTLTAKQGHGNGGRAGAECVSQSKK